MELGIGSYAFRWAVGTAAFTPARPLDVRGMIAETAALGAGLLQIADNAELDAMDERGRREVRADADRAGVRLQTGTSGLTTERMMHQLAIASDLGADVVRVVLDGAGVNPTPEQTEAVLREVAPHFEAAGVIVAIENHFLTPSPDIVDVLEAIESPALGVCLDMANSIMVGEWPSSTMSMLGPHTVNVHLKDYAVESDPLGVGGHVVGRRIGEGWLNLAEALDWIDRADLRMDGRVGVIIEQWLPLAATEEETLAAEREGREGNFRAARELLASHGLDRLTHAGGAR